MNHSNTSDGSDFRHILQLFISLELKLGMKQTEYDQIFLTQNLPTLF